MVGVPSEMVGAPPGCGNLDQSINLNVDTIPGDHITLVLRRRRVCLDGQSRRRRACLDAQRRRRRVSLDAQSYFTVNDFTAIPFGR